ncbi:MAG: response regulator [Nitrospirae bacterium]|jgi:DNA-binding NtrC family response regulator|nr:response regulator [Nitrospirota bacterium]MBS1126062.1 response regulator [Nitrospirota bacterium]
MSKGRILVVDDEDIVRTSCSRTLSPEGYEVKLAKNGSEGLKMAREDKFDLVLTDLKMPDMDGIEVLRIIKEQWPETEVIIVTGYQTVDTAVKAIKLGAYDYIEKPFTPDALISAVTEALSGKKKQ